MFKSASEAISNTGIFVRALKAARHFTNALHFGTIAEPEDQISARHLSLKILLALLLARHV
jgi:hypothetical protein